MTPRKSKTTSKAGSSRKLVLACGSAIVLAAIFAILFATRPKTESEKRARLARARQTVATFLHKKRKLPAPRASRLVDAEYDATLTINEKLQESVSRTLHNGKVRYGAFVAIDPRTGKILSMVSHGMGDENLNLRATFPAASVFKIVTAASALESGKLHSYSIIPVRGSLHTLYKQNVFQSGGLDPTAAVGRAWRYVSLTEALAKSVNSAFAKVGIYGVGPDALRETAGRLLFDREIPFEQPVEVSRAYIPNDPYGVAESASGFTRNTTLSPLHAALIAAAIANGGDLMEPGLISALRSRDGTVDYQFEPMQLGRVLSQEVANELARMMAQTIVSGTSHRAFRPWQRSRKFSDVFVAGKTGSLRGTNPPGKNDWFVGFARRGENSIAVAALCVHGEYSGVKASEVARIAFEEALSTN